MEKIMPLNQIVTFIGLGVMGLPIAKLISDGGYTVRAVDSFPDARLRASEMGLETFATVEEATGGSDFILMMLPTVEISEQVFASVLVSADRGSMIIEMGTIGQHTSAAHAVRARQKGVRYLDSPVIGGGREAAENGRLKMLVGGDESIVLAAEALLRCFSTRIFHVGSGDGVGQSMKIIHNLLLAGITAATAEALVLAETLGVEAEKSFEILQSSSTNSFALNWLFGPALQDDYSGGAKVDILLKDLRLAIGDVAMSSPQETWTVAKQVHQLYERCKESGYGSDDMAVVYRLLQNDAALTLRAGIKSVQ
jgi:3-hydroxyisobutyrate dehydrogenase-like beta-hydroxyacid dehydrogenase